VNGFYDTSKLFGAWFPSGGVGVEMAAITAGCGAIDLNFNWYGNLFNRDGFISAFRNRSGSWDLEAGYSQPLFDQAVDLRLKAVGYQFNIGTPVYGWKTGADVTTRDGVATVRYEYGHDQVNGSYNTIGVFVTVGLQLENILNWESPFTAPEPVFKSPRNLRNLLSKRVKREWHQRTAVVLARRALAPGGNCGATQQPIFLFRLVDKDSPSPGLVAEFDQPTAVPLALPIWLSALPFAGATSYSVAISDPDNVITTPTVSVTLTPSSGTLASLSVTPDFSSDIPHTITVARDGTPAEVSRIVVNTLGTPSAISGAAASGTITITGPGVQTLVIPVSRL
jgi:hypothetical protein